VEAHGTIASQHCVECEREADADAMWASIRKGEVFYCSECSHPVKPDIVFFGEAVRMTAIKLADLPNDMSSASQTIP
jgi:NAD-dependent histone deacetylase SIR2